MTSGASASSGRGTIPEDVEIVDYHERKRARWSKTIDPSIPASNTLPSTSRSTCKSANRLAPASSGVPPRRINEIVKGWLRGITADTALRLGRHFGTTDRFWLNLQTRYDLEIEKDHLGAALEAIHPLQSPPDPADPPKRHAAICGGSCGPSSPLTTCSGESFLGCLCHLLHIAVDTGNHLGHV